MTQSIENSTELANMLNERMVNRQGGNNLRVARLMGWYTKDPKNPIKANIPEYDRSRFAMEKYKFLLDAPFDISNKCCNVMKKDPCHRYEKETGRKAIIGTMAEESQLRTQKWIQNGCNGFQMAHPVSTPLSFWRENDILQYIVENNLSICSIYGDIVEDYGDELEGQMSLEDYGLYEKQKKLKCSGCQRTGCVLCGYGCTMESKEEARFLRLKETHPKFYALLDVFKNNGVTFREALEWTNEHMMGRGHIYF